MGILSNVPAIILLVLVVAFLGYTGFRLGLPFLVRRIAGLVFVLLSVSVITFLLGKAAPTNGIDGQLAERWTPARAALLYHHYGLDKSWWEQYLDFLNRLLHFDLGESWTIRGASVNDLIARQLPASLLLGGFAIVLAVAVGVSAGLFAAFRSNTRYDTTVQTAALFFFALPTFVLVPFFRVAMYWLYNNDLPHLPVTSTEFGFAHPEQMIAPILIFSAIQMAFFVRITRTSTLEVLRQDYVRTAKAKGLSNRAVVWRHTFRNALIPLITAIGPALALIVNGAFITEALFNIPGIGFTALSAISNNDFPILEGTVLLLAVSVVFMNLVTDVAYGIADPRIKSA
jgi:ABC-type dipeptide/oligopeptide/nickel transport system permease component